MEYLNTSSSKSLMEILKRFEAINKPNEVIINWHYEKCDEDIMEIGQDYQDIMNRPFNFIEY